MADILTRTYQLPADKVYLALIDAAQDTGMQLKKSDPKNLEMKLQTGWSWWSYGEKLEIKITQVGNESTVYMKSSRKVATNIMADTKTPLLNLAMALDKKLNQTTTTQK